MSLRFGTDGVRGVANAELTPELTLALGRAAARVLGGDRIPGAGAPTPPTMLLGRDTRRSGTMLAAALAAGCAAEGLDVIDLGMLPTPAVAAASVHTGMPAAMISASHNPFADNGIKFFSAGGRKLPDDIEARVEAELDRLLGVRADDAGHDSDVPVGTAVGTVVTAEWAAEHYVAGLVAALEGRRLDGLRVVLDCAHGAASEVAPEAFRILGADVTVLHDLPDGSNINARCGSTHPELLQETVVSRGADLGLAFDGDADRMLAVDHTGALVDGDQLMAMSAVDLGARGRLAHDTVVVTVMTNLGFKLAMAQHGIAVVVTDVGDRYVLDALQAGGYTLGGEQSGHVINTALATTGDGPLAGVLVCDLVVRSGRRLADLASVMTRLPQVLRNVKGVDRSRLAEAGAVWDEVAAVEAGFDGNGRVLIRPSGTEALVRVMVEAPTADEAEAACSRLCAVVERELG